MKRGDRVLRLKAIRAGGWLLLALTLQVVACRRPPSPAESLTLNAYLSTEPASLNFISQNDRSTESIGRLVCDTLVGFDRDVRLVPRLAASWDVSPDGRQVVFHLRSGVKWHDGAPFTAGDVAFSLAKVLDPASLAAGRRVYFETIDRYETPDDLTIKVMRSEPYARAVEVFEQLPILPRHLFAGRDFLSAPASRKPVGTGPYRFVSWEAGSSIELAANKGYFGGRPAIPRIRFRPMPDPGTRLEALLAGRLDLTSLRPLDREWIESHENLSPKVRILVQDTFFVWYIAWNMDGSNPFFADRRVRLAMTRATDRQGFVDHVLMGVGQVATSLVHPSMWAFDDSLKPWTFDPAAAARLLDAAGWRDHDGDGLRDHDGVPFRFTLLTPQGNQELPRLAALLQESLRTLGVEMSIRKVEYNLYRRERDSGRFQALLGGWQLDPDPDCYDFWHSSQRRGVGINYASYSNPQVDAMCEEGRRLLDRPARAALYRKVQAILHRDQPNTFIAYRASILGLSRRLQGLKPSPLGVWGWTPGPLAWRLAP